MVKLPWELLTPFSDFLRGIPTKRGGGGGINGLNANNPTVNAEDDDEEDDDEMQAYQDSMQRLKVGQCSLLRHTTHRGKISHHEPSNDGHGGGGGGGGDDGGDVGGAVLTECGRTPMKSPKR